MLTFLMTPFVVGLMTLILLHTLGYGLYKITGFNAVHPDDETGPVWSWFVNGCAGGLFIVVVGCVLFLVVTMIFCVGEIVLSPFHLSTWRS